MHLLRAGRVITLAAWRLSALIVLGEVVINAVYCARATYAEADILYLAAVNCAAWTTFSVIHLIAWSYLEDRRRAVSQLEFENDRSEINTFRQRTREKFRNRRLVYLPEEALENLALRQPRRRRNPFGYRQYLSELEERQEVATKRHTVLRWAQREVEAMLYHEPMTYHSDDPQKVH